MRGGIYILFCNNSRYYIGSTKDIKRRLFEHQNGLVRATKYLLPVKLVFSQAFSDIKTARQIEYKLKKYKNRDIIEQIIRDGYIKMGP